MAMRTRQAMKSLPIPDTTGNPGCRSRSIIAAIERLNDLNRLHELLIRVVQVERWEDLFPEAEQPAPRRRRRG